MQRACATLRSYEGSCTRSPIIIFSQKTRVPLPKAESGVCGPDKNVLITPRLWSLSTVLFDAFADPSTWLHAMHDRQ